VLTHVAVTPDSQACGIGSRLVGWFEGRAAESGCDSMVLVTASDKSGAGRFYRSRGWTATGEHCTPDGLRLTTYERPVDTVAGYDAASSE
jgi:GNAT superfamily N-acetyltransferase